MNQDEPFIAIVDQGHAVLIDGQAMLNEHLYLRVRDPAVGAYLERRDWFESQRLVSDDRLLSYPTFWSEATK